MQVNALDYRDGALEVKCSGEYGVGSEGNPSAELVRVSIERWIADHPDQPVAQIDVDYTDVDYTWGDGPVSSMVPFLARGIASCRIIAGLQNCQSPEELVATCRIPIEVIGRRDA